MNNDSVVVYRRRWTAFRGNAAGVSGSEEFTFGEIADAWRNGWLWRDPRWRTFTLMLTGVLLLLGGGAGAVMGGGSPGARLVVGGMLLYVVVQIVRGARRTASEGERRLEK
jgi:hypothetical protein